MGKILLDVYFSQFRNHLFIFGEDSTVYYKIYLGLNDDELIKNVDLLLQDNLLSMGSVIFFFQVIHL